MIKLQIATQDLRPKDIIFVNNPIGESENNGRIEDAIRCVQEKNQSITTSIGT